jgi:hypothetical protein
MLLLMGTSLVLFILLPMSPTMLGPVGMAFSVSMAVLGAIGILHWMHESSKGKSTGFMSNAIVQGQLHRFMNLPALLKLMVVLFVLVLPLAVDALM